MEVSSKNEAEVTIVSVSGSIDGFTSEKLLSELDGLIQAGTRKMVLDLRGVDFISSAGLRVILQAQKELRLSNGDLRLANSQERVLKVLRLTGYTSIFKVFQDTPAAVASFAS